MYVCCKLAYILNTSNCIHTYITRTYKAKETAHTTVTEHANFFLVVIHNL